MGRIFDNFCSEKGLFLFFFECTTRQINIFAKKFYYLCMIELKKFVHVCVFSCYFSDLLSTMVQMFLYNQDVLFLKTHEIYHNIKKVD